MKIRISACVIVRNEAENIGKWLESMRPIADEMIVVDTGSTDDTIAIARAGGAQVYQYVWKDDFAAAKNEALSKAKGDWILFLDADEYFTPASQLEVRPLLERLQPDLSIAGVLCRLINIDTDDGDRVMTSLVQLRMFRNQCRLRYEGQVHETLHIPKGKKLELNSQIEIFHTGYSTHIVQNKLRRNLSLLQAEIAANGGRKRPMDDRYFMDIWYGLGDHEQAILYAKKLIAQQDIAVDLLGRAYETWASCCIEDKRSDAETRACLSAAIAACPVLAEFPLMRGLWNFDRRDYLAAEQDLLNGMRLHERYQNDNIEGVMDNAARLLPTVDWRLGQLAEMQFQPMKAQDYYWRGVKRQPLHAGLFQAFYGFLREQQAEETDIIAILNAIYDVRRDAFFLTRQLARHRGGRVYLYYARKLSESERDQPILDYLSAGRMDAAAETAASRLGSLYRLGLLAAAEGAAGADRLQPLLPQNMTKLQQAAAEMQHYLANRKKG